MTKFFLVLHVLAAIVAVGPVTVAASMFPRALSRAHGRDNGADRATLRLLHRICRVYAAVGLTVPVFGFATASSLGVLGDAWLITSIVLTAAAAAVLALLLLPAQERALASPHTTDARTAARLSMLTGVFNLLWATVTVLMIIRPGSTTGA
ncbi:hypothetical protein H9Y04_43140 [Streptomyces sp. TRM66268-LWL]|uniref:Integral membrane protein n=1 Tax=Streptomyces polyasparticus TaxID=2767826 RepID=A0ABR7SWK6_9ACTN|nr:hypothetical protein [Streptomyces polyasparticus]MBC9719327.1 hypothetical protein [Streptomyces polyasparticus]